MVTDYGSLDIKITPDRDKDGNPIGVRKDGAKVVLKFVDMKSGHERHVVNVTSCVIDRMFDEGWIDQLQHQAAMQFLEDFHEAGLAPKLAASYGAFSAPHTGEMDDKQAQAHKRWTRAVRACGQGYGDIVCSVVLHDYAARMCEVGRLRQGLERLVEHYGKR